MTSNPPRYSLNEKPTYRDLLGEREWQKLHPLVQQRFSSNSKKAVTYKGVMKKVFLSKSGKVFAHFCRLIGTPLALYEGTDVPMTVNVYENKKLAGMTWDRFYEYIDHPINRIKSTKVILPEGILVEMVGFGLGMKLDVSQEGGAIFFESDYFFFQIGNKKVKIPSLMTPGKTVVSQRALTGKEFEFCLKVTHPLLGCVYEQVGVFSEEGFCNEE